MNVPACLRHLLEEAVRYLKWACCFLRPYRKNVIVASVAHNPSPAQEAKVRLRGPSSRPRSKPGVCSISFIAIFKRPGEPHLPHIVECDGRGRLCLLCRHSRHGAIMGREPCNPVVKQNQGSAKLALAVSCTCSPGEHLVQVTLLAHDQTVALLQWFQVGNNL